MEEEWAQTHPKAALTRHRGPRTAIAARRTVATVAAGAAAESTSAECRHAAVEGVARNWRHQRAVAVGDISRGSGEKQDSGGQIATTGGQPGGAIHRGPCASLARQLLVASPPAM
jgi:hypothetical protein